ncbi:phenylalanine--tRNA ligase subunit beta [Metallibacterium scheffleri]
MKFSERWLRALVGIAADRDALVEGLTMAGLEVEAVTALGAGLDHVVVGAIIECTPHPNAERLRVCRVDAGLAAPLQIVCGAANARAGLKAPLALEGALLPGAVAIRAADLRGVRSQGMLCSARELALDSDASGLMELPEDAPPGQALAEYLGLPDASIELKLTPNRADCFGMVGLAHDVAALFGGVTRLPDCAAVPARTARVRTVQLQAGDACPRYCGRVVEDLDAQAPTPLWMAERLRRAGLRPLSAIVDVANYVMLELGQPLHAFDDARVHGEIAVRAARTGERLRLLDGSDVELDGQLVISDARGAQALAGVMGGADSAVSTDTRTVFLESAHFAPAAIMGVARRFGLHSDAAHRFERGVDPELPARALERATALLLAICGGRAGPLQCSELPGWSAPRASIHLRRARLLRVLGLAIADSEVERILLALDIKLAREADGWLALVPTRRFDLAREEDLIEEVARIHGYAHVPSSLPSAAMPAPPEAARAHVPLRRLRAALAARDYREAVTLSLVGDALLAPWHMLETSLPLANPLSAELARMRPSLLPGLLAALRANRNRQQSRVRLFEIGRSFHPLPAVPREVERLALVACGTAALEQWGLPARALDFHDVKGDVEALLALRGDVTGGLRFAPDGLPTWLHPGRGARVLAGTQELGVIGALHPLLEQALGLEVDVYVAEFDLDRLREQSPPKPQALPRFPGVRRDLAIVVAEAVTWAEIEAQTRAAAGKVLAELRLFDVYRGAGLDPGHKSYAMGLILQEHSRTLTDTDADACVSRVLQALAQAYAARIRG